MHHFFDVSLQLLRGDVLMHCALVVLVAGPVIGVIMGGPAPAVEAFALALATNITQAEVSLTSPIVQELAISLIAWYVLYFSALAFHLFAPISRSRRYWHYFSPIQLYHYGVEICRHLITLCKIWRRRHERG